MTSKKCKSEYPIYSVFITNVPNPTIDRRYIYVSPNLKHHGGMDGT